jgi:osmoprotectant transport system ATP-binding protein
LVTHDTYGAFKLGTRVMVMSEGKLLQFDTTQTIVHHPAAPLRRRPDGQPDDSCQETPIATALPDNKSLRTSKNFFFFEKAG